MTDLLHNQLRDIVRTYGLDIVKDPRRIEGLLRDSCVNFQREINLIVSAQKANIIEDLLDDTKILPKRLLVDQLAQKLQDQYGFAEFFARWAVETWSLALGVISENNLSSERSSYIFMSAPKVNNDLQNNAHLSLAAIRDESSHLVYRIRHQDTNNEILTLRCRSKFENAPAKLLWYQEEVNHLLSYILSKNNQKPVILTGYNCFGGSFLTDWSIHQARNELSDKHGLNIKDTIVHINTDLIGNGIEHLYNNFYQALVDMNDKRTVKMALNRINDIHNICNTTNDSRLSGIYLSNRDVMIENLAGNGNYSSSLDSPSIPTHEAKDVDVHRLKMLAVLQGLSHILDNEVPNTRFASISSRFRHRRLPRRLIMVLDRIDNWVQLKEIESILQVRGAVKIICIVDKHDLDRWNQNSRIKTWIQRNFAVINCAPIWQENIALRFCERHFFLDDNVRRNALFADFIGGLNFCCYGAPGKFLRTLEEHWKDHIVSTSIDASLTLAGHSIIMQQYNYWNKVGNILDTNWKKLIGSAIPIISSTYIPLNDRESRARNILYALSNIIMEIFNEEFTLNDLFRRSKSDLRVARLVNPGPDLFDTCRKLLQNMVEEGLLDVRRVSKKLEAGNSFELETTPILTHDSHDNDINENIITKNRKTGQIRTIMTEFFSAEDFDHFCYDNFPRVYDRFTDNMPKTTRVQFLIDHCVRSRILVQLHAMVQQLRPDLFDPVSQAIPQRASMVQPYSDANEVW